MRLCSNGNRWEPPHSSNHTLTVRAGGESGAEGRTRPTSQSPHTGKTHREHPPVALPVHFPVFFAFRKRRRRRRRRRLQRSAAEVVTATGLLLTGCRVGRLRRDGKHALTDPDLEFASFFSSSSSPPSFCPWIISPRTNTTTTTTTLPR